MTSQAGYALDDEEHSEGICAVGVAFQDPLGRPVALSIPVPSTRFERRKSELVDQLFASRQRAKRHARLLGSDMGTRMILSKERDLRLVTIRRGGTLTDAHHRLLALWAADCAAHVLHLFEAVRPGDERVRVTIELARAWGRGEIGMKRARQAALAAKAARELTGAAKYAALSASQAVVVSHVAAHNLGAAAYAIRAARAAAPEAEQQDVAQRECAWQRAQLPPEIRELVLDDQQRRNVLCWSVFDAQ